MGVRVCRVRVLDCYAGGLTRVRENKNKTAKIVNTFDVCFKIA